MLDRLKTCSRSIAIAIVRYVSRAGSDPDRVLQQVLELLRARSFDYPRASHRFGFLKLMRVLFQAGATLTHSCFLLDGLSTRDLQQLLDLGGGEILTWIQDGLLTSAMSGRAKRNRVLKWILSALKRSFHQRTILSIWTDSDAVIAYSGLVAAFDAALKKSWHQAVEAIYDTCQQFGCTAYYAHVDPHINSIVMQSCIDRDWDRAIEAVNKPEATAGSHQPPSTWHEDRERAEHEKVFEKAMLAEDVQTIDELFNEQPWRWEWIETSKKSKSDAIAALAAIHDGLGGILTLLKIRRVGAMSFLLRHYSHWTEIFQGQSQVATLDGLEDYLYRKEYHKWCHRFPCCMLIPRSLSHQIVLRALSYHAIHKSDTTLFRWLHDHGLVTTSMMVVRNHHNTTLSALYSHPCQKVNLLNTASTHENDEPLLPSLLGVAVLQDHDPTIITHLLGQHIACRDSDALLHAVQSKAQPDIIQVLLSANPSGGAVSRTQYGSAALRVAILDQNYELMRVLAPVTDIHGLGQIDHDDRNLAYLDPLGEAVLQKDRAAVQILLENSADLNRVVVFEGLQKSTPRSASNSVLLRMTPLLIAIDVGDYDMVQFLVDSGAEINRDARLGLLRTPLQRASEIGDFEMVEYLISQGATIDSAPVYGGGTALQLAAMSGHTGIAKLLIENGADVNHAPAHGPGRTAFEAAAEWFRPDMMNLLVQHGARLDMEIGQEVEECVERQGKVFRAYESVAVWRTELKWRTQYERALQFAEDRKEYVSKGIVEKLGRLFGIHMDGNVLEITY